MLFVFLGKTPYSVLVKRCNIYEFLVSPGSAEALFKRGMIK